MKIENATCILGIETSCDETAAAVVADGKEVLSNVVASQIDRHSPYGGVVPELAAREHLKAIEPVAGQALDKAGKEMKDIDAVAVTNGPGLMPALLVGLNFAKGVALANSIPIIGINHFIAHIYGSFFDVGVDNLENPENFPVLSLVVSGGHTALVLLSHDGTVRQIGQTLDDAAGEAFDKAAKLMNLGYPGGPVIEKLSVNGDSAKFKFPRGLTGGGGKGLSEKNRFNFSFSGVKTALLYHCRDNGGGETLEGQILYDTIASYQEAIVDVLIQKTLDAATHFCVKTIVVCGGVACNGVLRDRFSEKVDKNVKLILSPRKYCTDNAAMVAGLACHYFKKNQTDSFDIDAYSRLPDLSSVPF